MKVEVDRIDAVPSKRLFLSIIADYDLNRSICELVDNALDTWLRYNPESKLEILIELEKTQQTIRVADNAGGVKKSDLRIIVGPGQTGNQPEDNTIGIFGVGTKRAVVALAQDVKITTRHDKDKTYRVEFDDSWLKSDDWELPVYEVDELPEKTTIVELQKLRIKLTDEGLSQLSDHLEATYAIFLLQGKVSIKLNNLPLKPHTFEEWAYPPGFEPRHYYGVLKTEDNKSVKVSVTAGLSSESSPAGGEYGIYLYCNNRLIERGLKSYDVGFTRGLAGKPHPSISLTRIIISLYGEVRLMPWNSSKSGINPNHEVFIALRGWLVQVVKDFASLSRRLEGNWQEEVFQYKTGKIVEQEISDFPNATKSYLPELPRSKLRYADLIKQANRQTSNSKPWTTGLYESIIAVDLILKQKLEQKNRIALLLLDSTLEIAFKEFLVNESGKHYSEPELVKLFNSRNEVQKEVSKYVSVKAKTWKKINYYYNIRCNIVHERSSVAISDPQVEDYRRLVQLMLQKLFNLKFKMKGQG